MTEKSVQFDDKAIHYKLYGNGKPVMLIHGFGEDSTVWQPQIDHLSKHFQLIVPDLPGTGRSELINGANIDTYAEVVKTIIDSELPGVGDSGISIIGHSMGGYVTLAFAEKYSDYLNSFGLFHSTAFADTEEKKETRRKAIGFINEKGAETFLRTSTPGLFTSQFAAVQPEKVAGLIESGKQFTNAALVQYYEAMIERPDRIEVLKNFSKPILFIIGEHDTAIPFQSSLQQCYIPTQSHVHILSNSAHMGMWEETEKANQALADFLNQV